MSGTVAIRRIRADEAQALRDLRLRALAAAPDAFAATLPEEIALPEGVWHRRAQEGAQGRDVVTFVAEDGGRLVGMATGLASDRDGPALLVGMFVEPTHRRRGIGAALVQAVAGWARARGAAGVHLWVTDTNAPAIALYQRCGFLPSGTRKPMARAPALSEIQMRREV